MEKESVDYRREKARRKHEEKAARTALEKELPVIIKHLEDIRYLLITMAMFIVAVFVKLVIMSW